MARPRNKFKCSICRQRKIKCDQRKPSCSQCIKAKWTCPGYDTPLSSYNGENRSENDPIRRSSNVPERGSIECKEATESIQWRSGISPSSVPQPTRLDLISNTQWFSSAETYALQLEFVSKIVNRHLTARFGVLPAEPYLRLIPARIGQNAVLDQAVKCLCASSTPDFTAVSFDSGLAYRPLYLKTLENLQTALNDQLASKSTEVLTTVMLLQMLEQHMNWEGESWVIHARGATRLIEHRGPDAFDSELDHAILEAEMGNIVLQSLALGKSCFLSESNWTKTLQDFQMGAFLGSKEGRMSSLERQYVLVALRFPGIISRYLSLRPYCSKDHQTFNKAVCQGTIPQEATAPDLFGRILSFRLLVRQLLNGPQAVTGVATATEDHNKNQGQTTLYWALQAAVPTFLMVADHMLVQLQRYPEICFSQSSNVSHDLLDELVIFEECTKAVEHLRFALEKVSSIQPESALAVKNSMRGVWNRVTALRLTDPVRSGDTVLMAVGDIWIE